MQDLDDRYDRLMHRICVRQGWCGSIVDGEPSHVDDYNPSAGDVTAAQFAEWVILADGEDPGGDEAIRRGWHGKLRNSLIEGMGADRVPALVLVWSSVR